MTTFGSPGLRVAHPQPAKPVPRNAMIAFASVLSDASSTSTSTVNTLDSSTVQPSSRHVITVDR